MSFDIQEKDLLQGVSLISIRGTRTKIVAGGINQCSALPQGHLLFAAGAVWK